MQATLYLLRHGEVIKEAPFDTLALSGKAFRDWLPSFFEKRGAPLEAVYYDDGVKRCAATLAKVDCGARTGYGPGKSRKTLNAVLGDITKGQHALCCRGDSIESGQLYHVQDFELHTPFSIPNHGVEAHKRMKNAYHVIYVLELMEGFWRQTGKVSMPPLPRS